MIVRIKKILQTWKPARFWQVSFPSAISENRPKPATGLYAFTKDLNARIMQKYTKRPRPSYSLYYLDGGTNLCLASASLVILRGCMNLHS